MWNHFPSRDNERVRINCRFSFEADTRISSREVRWEVALMRLVLWIRRVSTGKEPGRTRVNERKVEGWGRYLYGGPGMNPDSGLKPPLLLCALVRCKRGLEFWFGAS